MKQTAVDFLFEKLWNTPIDKLTWHAILEQAKQMEKEQIMDAFGVGCQVEATKLIGYHEMAEQYYKETFNGISKHTDTSH